MRDIVVNAINQIDFQIELEKVNSTARAVLSEGCAKLGRCPAIMSLNCCQ